MIQSPNCVGKIRDDFFSFGKITYLSRLVLKGETLCNVKGWVVWDGLHIQPKPKARGHNTWNFFRDFISYYLNYLGQFYFTAYSSSSRRRAYFFTFVSGISHKNLKFVLWGFLQTRKQFLSNKANFYNRKSQHNITHTSYREMHMLKYSKNTYRNYFVTAQCNV